MRVLFAITKGDVGGAQRHLEILAVGLTRRGHDVGAVVEQPSPLASRLAAAGVEVADWPDITREPHPKRDLRARRQLAAAVRSFEPDVLHVHSAKAGVLGRGLLAPPRGVTVFTCHHASFGPGRRWSHRLVGRPMEQLSLRFVDAIITVGTRDLPMLAKLAPGVPVHLVRNAVPVEGPPRSPQVPVPAAMWVARMKHPKDPVMAIRAWERVVRAHPEARLRLAGTGPLESQVRAAVAASPARERIDYEGFLPDLDDAYAEASIFLLTSHVEGGTTMATLEAMSNGLVPVVTDAGDAWTLPHHGAGVLAHRSHAAVAGAVIDLLDDRDRLAQLRSGALRYSRQLFTPDTMLAGTLEAYAAAATRGRLGDRVDDRGDPVLVAR